jgi:hypothetical protein
MKLFFLALPEYNANQSLNNSKILMIIIVIFRSLPLLTITIAMHSSISSSSKDRAAHSVDQRLRQMKIAASKNQHLVIQNKATRIVCVKIYDNDLEPLPNKRQLRQQKRQQSDRE